MIAIQALKILAVFEDVGDAFPSPLGLILWHTML
jgi:hypothetical protein